MLAEIFSEIVHEPVSDKVSLYKLTAAGDCTDRECRPSKKQAAGNKIELIFCLDGSFSLGVGSGNRAEISRDSIVLISHEADVNSLAVHEALSAYSLVLDRDTFRSFMSLYTALDCKSLGFDEIQGILMLNGGFMVLRHCFWSRSFFTILHSISPAEQGIYCVLKAAELLYLLGTHQDFSADMFSPAAMPEYLGQTLNSIGSYIENHLDGKLSISALARRFNLSPTTLKNKFREFYGQPVHSWILSRRIQKAAELLRFTDMTVLQVAQAVGYESTSQFNVNFKNTFGISPSAYRKNVRNSKNVADSVGNLS